MQDLEFIPQNSDQVRLRVPIKPQARFTHCIQPAITVPGPTYIVFIVAMQSVAVKQTQQ
jgi:hypothetical protein